MRCFVVICLLATSAYADVSHVTGYTYQQGSHGGQEFGGLGGSVSSGFGGVSGFSSTGGSSGLGGSSGFSSTGGSSGLGGSSGSGGFGGFSGSVGSVGSAGSVGSSGSYGGLGGSILSGSGLSGGGLSGGGVSGGFVSGNAGHSHHHHQQQHRVEEEPAEVEFVKEFYTFDAPQEEYHEDESVQRTKESIKKNLQVVFIKTPEVHGIERAALSIAKSASESNTAIYILQKQPDVSAFSNQLNLIHTHNAHKPEVHFVKYRTPEEAANAQQTIQAQYESLGGSSVHKHGGVPEILNFASQYAPGFGNHQVSTGGAHHVSTGGAHHVSTGGHQVQHTSGSVSHSGNSGVVSTGGSSGSLVSSGHGQEAVVLSPTYLPASTK